MKPVRTMLVVITLLAFFAALIAASEQQTRAQNKITGWLPDQATINVILTAMNAERDRAESLVKRDTGIVVDIQPLKWSSTLGQLAEERLKKRFASYDGADHLDTAVAENVLPYGYGPNKFSKTPFPATDLVKGWTGLNDSCTAAEWAANAYQACGEKAANSFVVVDKAAGTYKRACNVGVPDNRKMATCGHYGNVIEKAYKTVGCARVEKTISAELTNGGWSCVFSDKEVQ